LAKKRTAARKPVHAKKPRAKARPKATADSSRLDTAPLQDHIRKRIKELEGKTARSKAARQADDGTLERLRIALETLEDICEPTMTIPI
jgi:hypothetical protein